MTRKRKFWSFLGLTAVTFNLGGDRHSLLGIKTEALKRPLEISRDRLFALIDVSNNLARGHYAALHPESKGGI